MLTTSSSERNQPQQPRLYSTVVPSSSPPSSSSSPSSSPFVSLGSPTTTTLTNDDDDDDCYDRYDHDPYAAVDCLCVQQLLLSSSPRTFIAPSSTKREPSAAPASASSPFSSTPAASADQMLQTTKKEDEKTKEEEGGRRTTNPIRLPFSSASSSLSSSSSSPFASFLDGTRGVDFEALAFSDEEKKKKKQENENENEKEKEGVTLLQEAEVEAAEAGTSFSDWEGIPHLHHQQDNQQEEETFFGVSPERTFASSLSMLHSSSSFLPSVSASSSSSSSSFAFARQTIEEAKADEEEEDEEKGGLIDMSASPLYYYDFQPHEELFSSLFFNEADDEESERRRNEEEPLSTTFTPSSALQLIDDLLLSDSSSSLLSSTSLAASIDNSSINNILDSFLVEHQHQLTSSTSSLSSLSAPLFQSSSFPYPSSETTRLSTRMYELLCRLHELGQVSPQVLLYLAQIAQPSLLFSRLLSSPSSSTTNTNANSNIDVVSALGSMFEILLPFLQDLKDFQQQRRRTIEIEEKEENVEEAFEALLKRFYDEIVLIEEQQEGDQERRKADVEAALTELFLIGRKTRSTFFCLEEAEGEEKNEPERRKRAGMAFVLMLGLWDVTLVLNRVSALQVLHLTNDSLPYNDHNGASTSVAKQFGFMVELQQVLQSWSSIQVEDYFRMIASTPLPFQKQQLAHTEPHLSFLLLNYILELLKMPLEELLSFHHWFTYLSRRHLRFLVQLLHIDTITLLNVRRRVVTATSSNSRSLSSSSSTIPNNFRPASSSSSSSSSLTSSVLFSPAVSTRRKRPAEAQLGREERFSLSLLSHSSSSSSSTTLSSAPSSSSSSSSQRPTLSLFGLQQQIPLSASTMSLVPPSSSASPLPSLPSSLSSSFNMEQLSSTTNDDTSQPLDRIWEHFAQDLPPSLLPFFSSPSTSSPPRSSSASSSLTTSTETAPTLLSTEPSSSVFPSLSRASLFQQQQQQAQQSPTLLFQRPQQLQIEQHQPQKDAEDRQRLTVKTEQMISPVRAASSSIARPVPSTLRYEIRIARQPPAECVYRRILRPNPSIMFLNRPSDVQMTNFFVKASLWWEDPTPSAAPPSSTSPSLQLKELEGELDGILTARFSQGAFATFKRLKVRSTCTALRVRHVRMKFTLMEWRENAFAVIHDCAVVSDPIRVFSHSSYLHKRKKRNSITSSALSSTVTTNTDASGEEEKSKEKGESMTTTTTITMPIPVVTDVLPDVVSIGGGTKVVVLGSNFVNSPLLRVRFGTIVVEAIFHEDRTIVCVSPSLLSLFNTSSSASASAATSSSSSSAFARGRKRSAEDRRRLNDEEDDFEADSDEEEQQQQDRDEEEVAAEIRRTRRVSVSVANDGVNFCATNVSFHIQM
ncbi:hypothetical protein QOT17_010968 [Balamuthia mandrillaris]